MSKEQERFYKVYADIGEVFLSWITGEAVVILANRLGLLIRGAWLPGLGDYKTIAGLTNRPESTIERIARGRDKYKLGATAFIPLDRVAVPGDSTSTDHLDESE